MTSAFEWNNSMMEKTRHSVKVPQTRNYSFKNGSSLTVDSFRSRQNTTTMGIKQHDKFNITTPLHSKTAKGPYLDFGELEAVTPEEIFSTN